MVEYGHNISKCTWLMVVDDKNTMLEVIEDPES